MRSIKKSKTRRLAHKQAKSAPGARASNLQQAAGRLKVSVAVLKWAKANGCPGFDPYNRVDTVAVSSWLESNSSGIAELDNKSQLEIERLRLVCRKMKFACQVEEGEYIKHSLISSQLLQTSVDQKAMLRQKLENEYPALIEGLDEQQRAAVRALGKKLVDDICARYQQLYEKWKS